VLFFLFPIRKKQNHIRVRNENLLSAAVLLCLYLDLRHSYRNLVFGLDQHKNTGLDEAVAETVKLLCLPVICENTVAWLLSAIAKEE